MKLSHLLLTSFSLLLAISCNDATKKTADPIVPAETRATIEYNENQLDTITDGNATELNFMGGGNEPFWSVEFSKGKIHFKAPDATLKSFVAPIPEAEVNGNTVKYTAKSHRVLMEVVLTKDGCEDTMSGKKSSHKVKVSIKPVADEKFSVYEGCGS